MPVRQMYCDQKPSTKAPVVPAIRTLERFAEAYEYVKSAMGNLESGLSVTKDEIEKVSVVRSAMRNSPFQMVEGKVVRKRFVPRIVT